MTGKVIDSGAGSALILLLPLALVIVVLFVAWPLLVGLFVLGLAWKLWQIYQWQQLSKKINPIFNQLVQANQGCLTILDISMKANLNGRTARWYLDRQAQEYGAVRKLHEDRGIVYYFLTASALTSIFEDSEPESEAELAPLKTPSVTTPLSVDDTQKVEPEKISITPETEALLTTESKVTEETSLETVETSPPEESRPQPASESEAREEIPSLTLNQSELAKRLEVHSSTIGKRKHDSDFSLWSQSKDPEGIPWQYIEETKAFVALGHRSSIYY